GLEAGAAVLGGLVSPTTAVTAGGGLLASQIFTRALARPATASSMRAWSNAYRGLQSGTTPLRVSAFMAATRNLSHNLNIPERIILQATQDNQPVPEGTVPKVQPVGNK